MNMSIENELDARVAEFGHLEGDACRCAEECAPMT